MSGKSSTKGMLEGKTFMLHSVKLSHVCVASDWNKVFAVGVYIFLNSRPYLCHLGNVMNITTSLPLIMFGL